MKQLITLSLFICCAYWLNAQKYPEPEFANEVYYLKKDSVNSVMRLEKAASKMDTKTKMGGMGGAETGYEIDGDKSPVRLRSGYNLSFVFSTGASVSNVSSAEKDSMLRANGLDPAMVNSMSSMGSMSDPTNMISLYKVDVSKGKRKIVTMKSPGAMSFGKKSLGSADKITFSVKKIREGYWELVVDKTLPKGEYAFSSMNYGSADGSSLLFAFAVD
jgi:hypothetical protein